MISTRIECSRRTVLSAAGAAIGAVSVSGCLGPIADESDSDGSAQTGVLGAPADEITVTIRSDPAPEFDPQIVHVEVGAPVEWLVETGRHDVTSYHEDIRSFMHQAPHRTPDGVGAWRSDVLNGPGASYNRTFDIEGVYDYVDKQQVCVSHEVAGNVGRVVVGWPDPAEEPAMDPPPEDLPDRVVNALKLFNAETRPVLETGSNGTTKTEQRGAYRPAEHTETGRTP
jgi:plastocyanin